jgi:hypothetical protein
MAGHSSYNLKVAIEKATSILPTRLELNKLLTTLTDEEYEEYKSIMGDNPISKQIVEEQRLRFEHNVKKDQEKLKRMLDHEPGDSSSYDPLSEILGGVGMDGNKKGGHHEMFLEVIKEIKKDKPDFDPYKDPDETTKLISIKMFSRLAGNEEAVSRILDKTMGLNKKNNGKGINDPNLI